MVRDVQLRGVQARRAACSALRRPAPCAACSATPRRRCTTLRSRRDVASCEPRPVARDVPGRGAGVCPLASDDVQRRRCHSATSATPLGWGCHQHRGTTATHRGPTAVPYPQPPGSPATRSAQPRREPVRPTGRPNLGRVGRPPLARPSRGFASRRPNRGYRGQSVRTDRRQSGQARTDRAERDPTEPTETGRCSGPTDSMAQCRKAYGTGCCR